jgi:hypothetical protein
MTRRVGAVALLCVSLAASACTTSSSIARRSSHSGGGASTSSSVVSTTPPSIPSPAPACPPGCSHPSDYDALTALASSATLVAIVTVHSLGDDRSGGSVSVDDVLQGNPNGNIYPPTLGELPHLMRLANASVGKSYIIFTSFNRGGPCPSALFDYEPAGQVATFISQWDGPSGVQVPVPGIPTTIDIATLRTKLYPTGGVTYPVGTGESSCPGP